jgi:hypothetical protein
VAKTTANITTATSGLAKTTESIANESKTPFLRGLPSFSRKVNVAKRNITASSLRSMSQETLKATKYRVANMTTSRLFLGDHDNVLLA